MAKWALYHDFDPFKCEVVREAIKAGAVADGEVICGDIKELTADDVRGFRQFHAFAGGGFWSLALRNAGWPDDKPVWTGSCPCPSFSAAGKGGGFDDPRHLWPDWEKLIRVCRPATIFGEQADDSIGYGWLDLVQTDLEAQDYAVGKIVLGACSVGAPHIRQRLYFVADALRESGQRRTGSILGAKAKINCTRKPNGSIADRPQYGGENGLVAHSGHASRHAELVNEPREGLGRRPAKDGSLRPGPSGKTSGLGDPANRGCGIVGDAGEPGSGGHIDRAEQPGGVGDPKHAGLQECECECGVPCQATGGDARPQSERGSDSSGVENTIRGGFDSGSSSSARCESRDALAEYRGELSGVEHAHLPGAARLGADGRESTAEGRLRPRYCDSGESRRLADADGRQPRYGEIQRSGEHGQQPEDGGSGGLADAHDGRCEAGRLDRPGIDRSDSGGNSAPAEQSKTPELRAVGGTGPLKGFWRDCDWIHCRPERGYPNGRWRPVEGGTFPLAHGDPCRLGRIRLYGDAINVEVATAWIKAYLESVGK